LLKQNCSTTFCILWTKYVVSALYIFSLIEVGDVCCGACDLSDMKSQYCRSPDPEQLRNCHFSSLVTYWHVCGVRYAIELRLSFSYDERWFLLIPSKIVSTARLTLLISYNWYRLVWVLYNFITYFYTVYAFFF